MFIIVLSYHAPLEAIDQARPAHRAHLAEHYQRNQLLLSGPQNPRTGGILISQANSKEAVITMMQADPFVQQNLVSYEIIEFDPVMHHPDIPLEKIKK